MIDRSACIADRHGKATDYKNHGCRCPDARAEARRQQKTQHLRGPKHVPSIGARRRLRALMRMGWSLNHLSRAVGYSSDWALSPALYTRDHMTRDLDRRIREVYDRLWRTPGPSARARAHATRQGWPPPLWWDDDLIDDPHYNGEQEFTSRPTTTTRSTFATDLAEVAELTDSGWSAARIAQRLGCSERRVHRARQRIREGALSDLSASVTTIDGMRAAS